MKNKVMVSSFLLVITIALATYFYSCKRENVENIYSPQKDAMFAPLSMANEVAENVNKSNIYQM